MPWIMFRSHLQPWWFRNGYFSSVFPCLSRSVWGRIWPEKANTNVISALIPAIQEMLAPILLEINQNMMQDVKGIRVLGEIGVYFRCEHIVRKRFKFIFGHEVLLVFYENDWWTKIKWGSFCLLIVFSTSKFDLKYDYMEGNLK